MSLRTCVKVMIVVVIGADWRTLLGGVESLIDSYSTRDLQASRLPATQGPDNNRGDKMRFQKGAR